MSSKRRPWEKTKDSGRRKVNSRNPRERILIVCEGEKTEPNYFRSFPVDKEVVEVDIYGEGMNTDRLIEEVISMQEEAKRNGLIYNQVWCVLDRNSFPPQNFNRAIQLAESNKIRVAYSNEAFEIWYLLHFHYFVDAASRSQYKGRLSNLLNLPYKKNSETMYAELLTKQPTAIKNATKLLNEYSPIKPEANNPSTTVHLLVQELNSRIN
jgi:hypothetical protein